MLWCIVNLKSTEDVHSINLHNSFEGKKINVANEEMLKRYSWNFVFTVDSFLEDTKDGMPLEEQLRILLDKMDAANASRKPGMFDTMMISWELYLEWRI